MQEGTSIDDILNGTTPESETEAPEAPANTETADDGPVRDEKGRFASKGVEDEAGPPPDKLPQAEYKAIREERDKRQSIERELEALRNELQSLKQPKEPEAPPPSLWEDEQGWQQHFGAQIAQQTSLNARLDMSEMLASQAHDDFDDIKAKFVEMAQGNPALVQQALQAKHPWEKAYQIAKNAVTAAELGATNIDELRAKIREEVMAEIGQQPARPSLPATLTTERNVGARSGPAWSGPKSLEELLRS